MQIGHGKQGILIGEYGMSRPEGLFSSDECKASVVSDSSSPDKNRLLGWIEPAQSMGSWIIWFTAQGDAVIYQHREPNGATFGEPIRLKGNGEGNDDEHHPRTALRPSTIFYGPFACDKCAARICRTARASGGEEFTYPDGPIYPNTEWAPHVCLQGDVEKVNGLLSKGWRPPTDGPGPRPDDAPLSMFP